MEAFWQKAGERRVPVRRRVSPMIRHPFLGLCFMEIPRLPLTGEWVPILCPSTLFSEAAKKEGERLEDDHKPSSVPFASRSGRGRRDDGHLSRILIAQHLKRSHPSRLSPANAGANSNGLFSPLFRGAGPIRSCSGWGLPSYPDRSGYW